jgi:hypothetical protein
LDGSQPGELDEVVWFVVRELKLTKALSALAPPETYIEEETGEEIERRTMYPPLVLNVLGIMSRLLGLGSGPEVQAKLLTDARWMTLLGFTSQEVPPTFEGAGRVRRKVKVASKARRPKQVEVTILGFKVWYLMCVVTGLPIAFEFDRIEKSEQEHAKALIDQGRANLAGHARLVSVALDRGFLDGDFFWWLKEDRGIEWYCPSKEKMDVTAEARQRVAEALATAAKKGETALETALRLAFSTLHPHQESMPAMKPFVLCSMW